jgi:hypothetical protein
MSKNFVVTLIYHRHKLIGLNAGYLVCKIVPAFMWLEVPISGCSNFDTKAKGMKYLTSTASEKTGEYKKLHKEIFIFILRYCDYVKEDELKRRVAVMEENVKTFRPKTSGEETK